MQPVNTQLRDVPYVSHGNIFSLLMSLCLWFLDNLVVMSDLLLDL